MEFGALVVLKLSKFTNICMSEIFGPDLDVVNIIVMILLGLEMGQMGRLKNAFRSIKNRIFYVNKN